MLPMNKSLTNLFDTKSQKRSTRVKGSVKLTKEFSWSSLCSTWSLLRTYQPSISIFFHLSPTSAGTALYVIVSLACYKIWPLSLSLSDFLFGSSFRVIIWLLSMVINCWCTKISRIYQEREKLFVLRTGGVINWVASNVESQTLLTSKSCGNINESRIVTSDFFRLLNMGIIYDPLFCWTTPDMVNIVFKAIHCRSI